MTPLEIPKTFSNAWGLKSKVDCQMSTKKVNANKLWEPFGILLQRVKQAQTRRDQSAKWRPKLLPQENGLTPRGATFWENGKSKLRNSTCHTKPKGQSRRVSVLRLVCNSSPNDSERVYCFHTHRAKRHHSLGICAPVATTQCGYQHGVHALITSRTSSDRLLAAISCMNRPKQHLLAQAPVRGGVQIDTTHATSVCSSTNLARFQRLKSPTKRKLRQQPEHI